LSNEYPQIPYHRAHDTGRRQNGYPGSTPIRCRCMMATGNVVGILGTYEDITERKEAEDALKRCLRRTRDPHPTAHQRAVSSQRAAQNRRSSTASGLRRELLISRERYALAVNAGQVGIWEWNLRDRELYLDPFSDHYLAPGSAGRSQPRQKLSMRRYSSRRSQRCCSGVYCRKSLKGDRPTYEIGMPHTSFQSGTALGTGARIGH
jgi:hypothetical protein